MKLNDIRPNVETSGDLEEQFFSIEDQGMIFDILRNKMYSNPILAICREISCNARDTHREVGKPEVPIHINLPTSLEPYYKIKDFGRGISPDRMSNVFIKYTASTKREDNMQTGGFGLGAKTPFSYSDSFAITTNVNGRQYHYTCFIDPTKVGKLALNHEAPTKEPNGTEIQIPVLPKDFGEFATLTEQACRHWTTKPVIKNGNINWQKNEPIIEGQDWKITQTTHWNRNVKAVIDGIEYPLETDVLRRYTDSKLFDAARGDLILYFGIGELSLSANREQIYLDKKTQAVLNTRMKAVYAEIKDTVSRKIEAFPDLLQANIYWRKDLRQAFATCEFLGKMSWRGITLHQDFVHLKCPVFHFEKGRYRSRGANDPNKISRTTTKHLNFEERTEIYINDLSLAEPTNRHVKKAFEKDANLKTVQVVCPNVTATLDMLEQSINLSLMAPKLLSSITKATSRPYTPASSRLLVFKFERDHSFSGFRQVSYSSLEEDPQEKILCFLSKNSRSYERYVNLENKRTISPTVLEGIAVRFPTYSFYGVDADTSTKRIEEDLSDTTKFDEFIEENILTGATDYVKVKYAEMHLSDLDDRMLRNSKSIKPLITDPQSFYLRRLRLNEEIRSIYDSGKDLLATFEAVNGSVADTDVEKMILDHPEYDLEKITQACQDAYPLLSYLNYYNYGSQDFEKHMAEYINMIDLKIEEQKNV